MSQVMRRGRLCIGLALFVLLMAGCSSPNTEVGFDPNTGKHTANWLNVHGSAYMTYDGQCAGCHGNRLDGGISAVACFGNTNCHDVNTMNAGCGTCHTLPPSGAFFPNTAGKHAGHKSFPNLDSCDSCHTGAGGNNPPNHMNYVTEVVFSLSMQTTYKANSGTAIAYDAASQTCSKISCHGGQTTPNWVIGSLDVNSQCGACHISGTTEYNSYFSGEHSTHLGTQVGAACTDCHDTTRLAAVHFSDLNTTAMPDAYLTLLNALNYTGAGGGTFGNCTINCHDENHDARAW